MYVIKSKDNVELFEDTRLLARPSSIIVIASETDPTNWHGSLTICKPIDSELGQSLRTNGSFVVAFGNNGQNLLGVIKVTETPLDLGPFVWVEFRGHDIFHLR